MNFIFAAFRLFWKTIHPHRPATMTLNCGIKIRCCVQRMNTSKGHGMDFNILHCLLIGVRLLLFTLCIPDNYSDFQFHFNCRWGRGSWCKPSCIPITIILTLIVLVVLLPLIEHNEKLSPKRNSSPYICSDNCRYINIVTNNM